MTKLTDWAGHYRASKGAFEKGLKKEKEHVERLQGLVRDRLQVIMKQSRGNTAQVVIVQIRGFVKDLRDMVGILSNSQIRNDFESASDSIDQYLRQKNQEWLRQPDTIEIVKDAFSYIVSVLNVTVFKDLKTQLSILTHFGREFEEAA